MQESSVPPEPDGDSSSAQTGKAEPSAAPEPASDARAESASPGAASDIADEPHGPSHDLIVGLVGAVGTDLPFVERTLETHLQSLGFRVFMRSLSSLINREFGGGLRSRDEVPYDQYVMERMTAGNVLREHWDSADAVALLAIEEIRRTRDDLPDESPGCAFIVRSVKRPEEVNLLRDVYRGQFVLIGCHASRTLRIKNLANQIARSRSSGRPDPHRAQAEVLADRDEQEQGPVTDPVEERKRLKDFGQSLEDTFPLADCYISLDELGLAEVSLKRFCDALLGSPFITPSKDEVAMFHAQAAGVRSADLSRQVGAAIATTAGDILAIGCNEVPRAGGGAYWEGDPNDARDFRLGRDGNQDQRDRAVQEVFDVLKARKLLTPDAVNAGAKAFRESLEDTRVDGLIEFTRATHAEMAALLDAARRGTSVLGCTLYTSAFPCHNCAKHIVAAGINRVVFIEPYPKSLAAELHGDAIAVDDASGCGASVTFEHFTGIAPHNYFPFFQARGKRKDGDGEPDRFSVATIKPKLQANFHANILRFEKAAIVDLEALRAALQSPAPDQLDSEPGTEVSSVEPT